MIAIVGWRVQKGTGFIWTARKEAHAPARHDDKVESLFHAHPFSANFHVIPPGPRPFLLVVWEISHKHAVMARKRDSPALPSDVNYLAGKFSTDVIDVDKRKPSNYGRGGGRKGLGSE